MMSLQQLILLLCFGNHSTPIHGAFDWSESVGKCKHSAIFSHAIHEYITNLSVSNGSIRHILRQWVVPTYMHVFHTAFYLRSGEVSPLDSAHMHTVSRMTL